MKGDIVFTRDEQTVLRSALANVDPTDRLRKGFLLQEWADHLGFTHEESKLLMKKIGNLYTVEDDDLFDLTATKE